MPKKCVPGGICLSNTTILLVVVLLLIIIYLGYQVQTLGNTGHHQMTQQNTSLSAPSSILMTTGGTVSSTVPIQDVRGDVGRCTAGGQTAGDPLTNPYVPPVRCDAGSLMTAPLVMSVPQNSIPVNIPTQHYNTQYNQVGILTKQAGSSPEILPLMGRRTVTSRDKWQYYTVSGGGPGGNLQAKLPVKVKGRNCSSEYGCSEIYNGDDVYVEGYQEIFRATIYESGLFSYIPI